MEKQDSTIMMRIIALMIVPVVYISTGDRLGNLFAQDYKNHLSVTYGVWADTDLPDLPGNAISGDLGVEHSNYVGLTYGRTLVDDLSIPIPFTEIRFQDWDIELEGTVIKHFNIQDHWEVAAALVLRTRRFIPIAFLGWTFAGGWGFSYACEEPALEKGPNGVPGEDSVQFQNHLVLELDFFYPESDRLHAIARIHHRSGMYGLISSQETGSNFIAAGIRWDF